MHVGHYMLKIIILIMEEFMKNMVLFNLYMINKTQEHHYLSLQLFVYYTVSMTMKITRHGHGPLGMTSSVL